MAKGVHANQLRSGEHYRWNRGRLRHSEGYAILRVGVGHPLADANGYAKEHYVIWCAAGNARPRPDQVLRFKNGDRTDCRIENLVLEPRRLLLARNNVAIRQDECGRFRREA